MLFFLLLSGLALAHNQCDPHYAEIARKVANYGPAKSYCAKHCQPTAKPVTITKTATITRKGVPTTTTVTVTETPTLAPRTNKCDPASEWKRVLKEKKADRVCKCFPTITPTKTKTKTSFVTSTPTVTSTATVTCGLSGSNCLSTNDCCGLPCNGNKCGGPTCLKENDQCDPLNPKCCSGQCTQGFNAFFCRSSCLADGSPCTLDNPGVCCGQICLVDGTCVTI